MFFGNLFRFFSRVLFPFAYLFKSSLPVIVLLSHEMLAGFLSNKGRNLIGKEQWVNGKIGSGFFRQMLLVFVCNFQNWSKFTIRGTGGKLYPRKRGLAPLSSLDPC